MKIGIIVHSFTGNTLLVAQKLQEALRAAGHTAEVERVVVKDENPNQSGHVTLENAPDPSGYDFVFFGAPVRGFSLTPGMTGYLTGLGALTGKPAACFVTKQLPYMWTGGTRALKQMTALVSGHGGKVLATGAVVWSGKERERRIDRTVAELCAAAAGETV